MSDIDLYGWERCTHANIGLPGCPTCDPDKHRVAARYERKLDEAHAEVARWQAIATRAVEALRSVQRRITRLKPFVDFESSPEGDDRDAGANFIGIVTDTGNAIAAFDAAGSTTALDEMLVAARKDQADTDELAFLEWISGTDSDDLPVEPKTERALAERDARVAIEARESALKEAAKLIEPKEPRPQSPDLSAYTNHDDAAFDWANHELTVAAAKIRALAKTPAQPCVPLADVLTIVREQPFYPDTNVGMRQQWVKDQIAEKIEAKR